MGKQWKQCQTIWGGSKIIADSDCSHKIKRCLHLGRKVMANVDSMLKSTNITLPTKVHLVKAMVFPVVMYCESWTIKKAECWRIDALELWCSRRLLSIPWTARTSNQSILKEISPECSLEGLCWNWNSNALATWCKELTHLKRPHCWERLKVGGEGNDRGWDGWMASPTQWTWVRVNSGMDREAWCSAVYGVAKSRTRLSDWTELNWVEVVNTRCNFINFVKGNKGYWVVALRGILFQPWGTGWWHGDLLADVTLH